MEEERGGGQTEVAEIMFALTPGCVSGGGGGGDGWERKAGRVERERRGD